MCPGNCLVQYLKIPSYLSMCHGAEKEKEKAATPQRRSCLYPFRENEFCLSSDTRWAGREGGS